MHVLGPVIAEALMVDPGFCHLIWFFTFCQSLLLLLLFQTFSKERGCVETKKKYKIYIIYNIYNIYIIIHIHIHM